MKATIRHRGISALAALAVVGGGTLALILGLAFELPRELPRRAIEAILPSRSEPVQPPAPPAPSPSPTAERGGSPPAPSSDAAPLVLPPPMFPPLVQSPPPVPAARNPGSGTAASGSEGEDSAGGGAGGGWGSGTGAGSGRGNGAGGYSAYPRQIAGKLHYWEIPKELRRSRAGVIRLRYRIGTDGHVSECTVIGSSGLPEFDRETCARITARFRFRPALDGQGRPAAFMMTETHGWDYEPAGE